MSQLQSNEATPTPTANEVRSMVERQGPTGIVVGAGGDPLIIGLPIFAVGALALGMALIGVVPATALGGVVPIILLATGLFLTVVTVWAALLAQTMVAGITGTFAGFWLSFGALVLGLGHGWWGVGAADVAGVQQLFFIAWGCLFVFLLVPTLRLPAVYPAIVALVVATLALAAAGARTGDANLLKAAGYVVLVFSLLGFCAFVNVALTAMGAKRPFPPLGRAPIS